MLNSRVRRVGQISSILGVMSTLSGNAFAATYRGSSDAAEGFDQLWYEVMVDITIIGLIFAFLTIYFLWKYRRRSPDEEGDQKPMTTTSMVGWAVIPAFIFMADDFFLSANGWQLYNVYRDVPENALEVKLESAMWTWDYTYPNGVKTFNELVVPEDQPVVLRMTSRDTIHSHFIPKYRIKEDSMPGRVTYMWFQSGKPGEHVVACAEYCGHLHSRMTGKVVVLPKEKFETWYKSQSEKQLAKL